MKFNSFEFLIFFPVVVTVYYLLPYMARNVFLLLASCVFYMAFIPSYVAFLALLIVIDFYAARFIVKKPERKKIFLIASIAATCSLLFIFKYFNFFNSNIAGGLHLLNLDWPVRNLDIILPIGLSFHTFQSLSYVVEVYTGRQKEENNFIVYSLYVMFFPQLVAGPIERPQNLLHQFYEKKSPQISNIVIGLERMLWGLFKKSFVADRICQYVDTVFNSPSQFNGPTLVLAAYLFAIQIYCDFSGYSDIAIGAAKVLGFDLMENFNLPYFSSSFREFWRRWHISLSTWFRDYVYIPLGGNRKGDRIYLNIFIVFSLCGLWHGANWTYIMWGAIHAYFLMMEGLLRKYSPANIISKSTYASLRPILNAASIFIVFSLTSFAWIFFRANNIQDALVIVSRLPYGFNELFAMFRYGISIDKLATIFSAPVSINYIAAVAFGIFMLLLVDVLGRSRAGREFLSNRPYSLKLGVLSVALWAILLFGVFDGNSFIYFQF